MKAHRITTTLGLLLLCVPSAGCFSSLHHTNSVRYKVVEPHVFVEQRGAPTYIAKATSESRGQVSFLVEATEECTITTKPRYQVFQVKKTDARGLPGAYTMGALGIAGGAGMLIGAVSMDGGLINNTSGKSEFTGKGAVALGGVMLGVLGLVVLPIAIYHTAKSGVTEEAGGIEFGLPPGNPSSPSALLRKGDRGLPRLAGSLLADPLHAGPRLARDRGDSGATTKVEVCSQRPAPNVEVVLGVRDEDGRRRVVSLGRTDARGTISVDMLATLRAMLPTWPDVWPPVDRRATLARADTPSEAIGMVDLSDLSQARFADHEGYVGVQRRRMIERAHAERAAREEREREQAKLDAARVAAVLAQEEREFRKAEAAKRRAQCAQAQAATCRISCLADAACLRKCNAQPCR